MRRLALLALAAVLAGCGSAEVTAPTAKTVVGTLPTKTVAKGDATNGKKLFSTQGCTGCHTYKPAGATAKVGPDLDNLAADAQKANQGSLQEYTAESIKNPSAYIVPGYPSGVMPSYSELSDNDVADLVAFLTQGS